MGPLGSPEAYPGFRHGPSWCQLLVSEGTGQGSAGIRLSLSSHNCPGLGVERASEVVLSVQWGRMDDGPGRIQQSRLVAHEPRVSWTHADNTGQERPRDGSERPFVARARIWKWVMGERDDELDAVRSHKLLSSLSKTAEPASYPPPHPPTSHHRTT